MKNLASIRNTFRLLAGSSGSNVGSMRIDKSLLCGNGTSNDIWTIVIDHPSKRNALTGKMMAEFADIVDQLESPSNEESNPKLVVLRGASNFFCAGADLSLAREHLDTKEKGFDMARLMQDTTSRLRNLGQVSVAVVEKGCYGGGTELALSCDHILMEEKAQFGMVQVSVKVSPGWGGANRLVKRIGRARALRILTTAPSLSAAECLKLGIIDEIIPDGKIVEEAIQEFAIPVIVHDKAALRACKLSVAAADNYPTQEALGFEAESFKSVWASSANKAQLNSIMSSLKR